ncbi:MAG: peptide chain release factor N(5)-glutamine methyltransferase [Alphaproteobacteria bacterium]
MLLHVLYKEITQSLLDGGIDMAALDARYIIEHRCGCDYSDIITNPDTEVSDVHVLDVKRDVEMRMAGVPLSRIYGVREFWGLGFEISADTLDPRPDTETIIDLAVGRFDKDVALNILDLGTGSGCILISLLTEFKNARGVGVDLSSDAIDMAKKNSVINKVETRSRFINGSWFDSVDGEFDLIVSNPPYIRSSVIPELSREVKNHDPILALDGGEDGLEPYRIIFSQIKNYFRPNGIALFEIGYDQGNDVMRLAEESGFVQRCVHMDLASNPRVVEISCGDK